MCAGRHMRFVSKILSADQNVDGYVEQIGKIFKI